MTQLVCTHCDAVNRLPDAKDPAVAKCGRCHQRLFEGHPAEVTGAQLETHRRSTKGAALLIDVWAPWCGPCRAMAPMFEQAARQLEPKVRALKLNSDKTPALSSRLNIAGIPTLLLMRGGREIARQAGAMDARSIVAWTEASLARS